MHDLRTLNAEQLASRYLEAIQRLTLELASAIAAVGRNDAASLEGHVQNQLGLCSLIQDLENYFRNSAPGGTLSTSAALRQELTSAIRDLKQANRAYAKVIAKSSRSQKMFLALYAACREARSSHSEPCPPPRTLSCEI